MTRPEIFYLKVNTDHSKFFSALSSNTRLKIIELLQNKSLSIQDISSILNISSAVVTKHINILESAEIIKSHSVKGVRGRLKMCSLNKDEVILIFNNNNDTEVKKVIEKDIPIGSFHTFDISAPCGMASENELIGYVDDPSVFYFLEKEKVQLLWFSDGKISYYLPTYDIDLNKLKKIEISLEICSEYPGYNNNFKSDIKFLLNDVDLVTWTSPGDYGDKKGRYTPKWWELGSEYGDLVTLKIDGKGSYLNGIKVHGMTLSELLNLKSEVLTFTISSPKETLNPGGLNLFGSKFGNHNQGIKLKYYYEND